MSSVSDDSPVTYGQLRHELVDQDKRFGERIDKILDARLAPYATKQDLETWGHAIIANLRAYMDETVQRVTRVMSEQHTREVAVVDDKYQDLPGRVSRLEAVVFPPKRTRRRS